MNSVEVIDKGMRCLTENLGSNYTELFITTILRERFDYTEWRKNFIDGIKTFDDLDRFVAASKDKGRFSGKAEVIV